MRPRLLPGHGLALLLCLLLAIGCTRWQETPATPSPQATLARTRVVLQNGRVIPVDNLTFGPDSLTGLIPGSSQPGYPLQRFAASRGEVARIYERQASLPRTIAVITLPVVAVVSSIFLLGY